MCFSVLCPLNLVLLYLNLSCNACNATNKKEKVMSLHFRFYSVICVLVLFGIGTIFVGCGGDEEAESNMAKSHESYYSVTDGEVGLPIISVEMVDGNNGKQYRLIADRFHEGFSIQTRVEYLNELSQKRVYLSHPVSIERGERFSAWVLLAGHVEKVVILPQEDVVRRIDGEYLEDILWRSFNEQYYTEYVPVEFPKEMSPVIDLVLVNHGDGFIEYKVVARSTLDLDLVTQVKVKIDAFLHPEHGLQYKEVLYDGVFLSKGTSESETIRVEVQETYALHLRYPSSFDLDPAVALDRVRREFNKPPDYSYGDPVRERFGSYFKGVKKLTNFSTEKTTVISVDKGE